MWNEPTKERLARIPKLYETEDVRLQNKTVHLHFFMGGCDWYIVEYDGHDLFWGYAILNSDFEMAEWGYVSFNEIRAINLSGLEVDCVLEAYFETQKASEIDKICKGNDWEKGEQNGIHTGTEPKAQRHTPQACLGCGKAHDKDLGAAL